MGHPAGLQALLWSLGGSAPEHPWQERHRCRHAYLERADEEPNVCHEGRCRLCVDETAKVVDDGKGWVWIAAEMSPGGLAIELFKSVPFGKRALFVAKASNVDEMFDKINWDIMDKRVDTTLGGPQVKQR